MPYKDLNKQREYGRNWQRKRRGTVGKTERDVPTLEWRLSTADDLKVVLEVIVTEVMDAEELDIGVKGRTISQLLAIGVKLLEVSSIEDRLTKLEQQRLPAAGVSR